MFNEKQELSSILQYVFLENQWAGYINKQLNVKAHPEQQREHVTCIFHGVK
jgi:hypothetical protein